MKELNDLDLIETSRKYGVSPGSMKCQVFALFERGYSRSDIRYLLRNYRDPRNPATFPATIRRYYTLWKSKRPA
jgi:hypothetical protein